mgnify:CR=1 FL=1
MQSQAFLGYSEREQILQSEYNYLRNLKYLLYMIRKLSILMLLIGLVSCHNGAKGRSAAFSDEDEENNSDSFSENVSHSSLAKEESKRDMESVSQMSFSEATKCITSIEAGLNDINSPDKLLELVVEYEHEISRLESSISNTDDDSKIGSLSGRIKDLREDYASKLRTYSMPANGIIQTIDMVSKRLEQCKSKSDLERILTPRYSYFHNLRNLYKIVEEESCRSEVRDKSEKLITLYEQKKSEFGISDL